MTIWKQTSEDKHTSISDLLFNAYCKLHKKKKKKKKKKKIKWCLAGKMGWIKDPCEVIITVSSP